MSAPVTFAVEPWLAFKREATALWDRHWEEIALNRDSIKLEVDHPVYDAMDRAGQLSVIVARSGGAIVGYWLGIVRGHLHYASSLTAHTDVYFIAPEFRKGRTGINLWKFVEVEMAKRGVQRVMTATKKHLDLSALFKHLGYTEVETVFAKVIRRAPPV